MAKRKEPKITTGLHRFIIGIFDHYHNRGMPARTAKIKSLDETYKVIRSVIEQDKEVPDYLVVVSIEHSVSLLKKRGQQLSQKLEKATDDKEIEKLRKSLRDLKQLVDQNEVFIEQYRGEVEDE